MNGLENIEVIALQHARVSSQSGPGGPLSLDKGDVIGLSGSVPSFAESPRLTELYLGYNDFGGSIPESFLKNVSKNQNIIVDLTMNSISGSLPNSLRRFNFLTIYVAGNQIESLDEAFCDMNMWMGGDVEINGCDAILCPIGTSNKYGRQTSAGPICQACAFTFSAPYYGSGECMADLKNYNEKEILEKLYDATGGPGWSFANNWKDDSKSICEWHGIHCMSEETDGAAQVVKEISLPSNGLTGIIPPQVFDLQYLEVLNIRVNAVDIQLSSVIRNSVNALKAMYLDNTLISSLNGIGKFKNLRTLHLQQNNFVGSSLPEDLFTLTKMRRLYISDSNIGGELSSSIGGLASLEEFYR
jgi:Leucine-rich repeat (LRR) protein